MTNFEIHDLTTDEIIADNVSFDAIPELFEAYRNYYPDHDLTVVSRIERPIKKYSNATVLHTKSYYDFRSQWLDMIEENSCNIY